MASDSRQKSDSSKKRPSSRRKDTAHRAERAPLDFSERTSLRKTKSERATLRGSSSASDTAKHRGVATRDDAAEKKMDRRPSRSPRLEGHLSEKQRLSSLKRDERVRRTRERLIRRIVFGVLLVATLVLLVWGAITLVRGPVFYATDIVIDGNSVVSSSVIKKIAAIAPDSSVLTLDRKSIERRIADDPWIASAEIDNKLPHTVSITVLERKPTAVVAFPSGQRWLIDDEGVWLGKVNEDGKGTTSVFDSRYDTRFDATNISIIKDMPTTSAKEGQKTVSPEVANSMRIVAGLSEELLSQVDRISCPSVTKTEIFTKKGIEIAIGDAGNIALKDRIARSILKAQAGNVVLINVRSVDAPTWRGLKK